MCWVDLAQYSKSFSMHFPPIVPRKKGFKSLSFSIKGFALCEKIQTFPTNKNVFYRNWEQNPITRFVTEVKMGSDVTKMN